MESVCEVIRCGNMYLVPGEVTEAPAAYILLQSILSYRACNCQRHLQDPYCLQPIARHKMSILNLSKTDIYRLTNGTDNYKPINVSDIY